MFENSICILSLQRLPNIIQVHIFDGRFFYSRNSLALHASHFHLFAFIIVKHSLSFPFLCEIYGFYLLLPFSFSFYVIHFIQKSVHHNIRASSTANCVSSFPTSFKAGSAINASRVGSTVCRTFWSGCENTRTML